MQGVFRQGGGFVREVFGSVCTVQPYNIMISRDDRCQ